MPHFKFFVQVSRSRKDGWFSQRNVERVRERVTSRDRESETGSVTGIDRERQRFRKTERQILRDLNTEREIHRGKKTER